MKRTAITCALVLTALCLPLFSGCQRTRAHTMSAYTVLEEPTYSSKGKLSRSCLDAGCDYTETKELRASAGLIYTESDGRIFVAGKGGCTDSVIYISSETQDRKKVYGIGASAFLDDKQITAVIVGKDVREIGSGAFAGCEALESVTLPDSAATIGSECFLSCEALASVRLPASLSAIPDNCFCGCISLIDVSFPEGLETIGYSAFNRCSSLNTAVFPETLQTVGSFAFCDCTSLASCRFPAGLTTLSSYSFSGSGLKSALLPPTLEKLGSCAFYRCRSLTDVFLPKEVRTVEAPEGMSPFYESSDRLTVRTDALEKSPGWDDGFDILFIPDAGNGETVRVRVLYKQQKN